MDLLNPTFLIFLGIIVLLIALLALYFENKFREQNHKITSMLSLVSTLADEINNSKIGLNNLTMMVGGNHVLNNMNSNNVHGMNLINVSDDEDEEDDDDEEEDDEEDEDEEEDDEEDDDDDTVNNSPDVKLRNMLSVGQHTAPYLEELADLNIIKINNIDDHMDNPSNNLSELYELDNNNCDLVDNIGNIKTTTMDLTDLQYELKLDIADYKKLSLTKLKNLVIDKGLSTEPNKLKKNDLIKLLENN